MPISESDRRAAVEDENNLREMNRLLKEAGAIADRLTYRGYDVMMTLWHEKIGSTTIHGRLQGNVSSARIVVAKERS